MDLEDFPGKGYDMDLIVQKSHFSNRVDLVGFP
jgi:hypothetical protein